MHEQVAMGRKQVVHLQEKLARAEAERDRLSATQIAHTQVAACACSLVDGERKNERERERERGVLDFACYMDPNHCESFSC